MLIEFSIVSICNTTGNFICRRHPNLLLRIRSTDDDQNILSILPCISTRGEENGAVSPPVSLAMSFFWVVLMGFVMPLIFVAAANFVIMSREMSRRRSMSKKLSREVQIYNKMHERRFAAFPKKKKSQSSRKKEDIALEYEKNNSGLIDVEDRRIWREKHFPGIPYLPFFNKQALSQAKELLDVDDYGNNILKWGTGDVDCLPVTGALAPSETPDLLRLELLEERIVASLNAEKEAERAGSEREDIGSTKDAETSKYLRFRSDHIMVLKQWASYGKGLRALLLQFSRARPGKDGRFDPSTISLRYETHSPSHRGNPAWDIEESWDLLVRCVAWRARHDIPTVFRRGWPKAARHELKRRLLNSFFFGHCKNPEGNDTGTISGGEPIYYNNFAMADMNHADLVPGIFSMNDLSIIWVQEMEYRERIIFPTASQRYGKLVNQMVVVVDALGTGMETRKLLRYLKSTAGLNSLYYPESVNKILVVNAPGLISLLYNFVKPFMPETTQKKVTFTSGNGNKELFELVGDQNMIPLEFGGLGPPKRKLLETFQDNLDVFLEKTGPCTDVYDCSPGFDDPTKTNLIQRRRLCDLGLADKQGLVGEGDREH